MTYHSFCAELLAPIIIVMLWYAVDIVKDDDPLILTPFATPKIVIGALPSRSTIVYIVPYGMLVGSSSVMVSQLAVQKKIVFFAVLEVAVKFAVAVCNS